MAHLTQTQRHKISAGKQTLILLIINILNTLKINSTTDPEKN
jgi:hypothetical protein